MINELISESIKKAYSYNHYRMFIKNLINTGASDVDDQSDPLFSYSVLNHKRMDRLDKTISLTQETKEIVENLKKRITFLVISEGLCGGAAYIVPFLNKIAIASNTIDLKIVLRDENETLMNQFLTNGSKSIPMVILVDEHNNVINSFGPRPSIATSMVLEYKQLNGSLDAEFKKDLQLWYNKHKGNNTQRDIIKLLKSA